MVKKNKYQLEIEKILDRSEKDLAKDLQSLYKSLASEITKDIAQLQKEIDTDDKHWKKLQKERLESIRASMYQQINQVEKLEKQSLWSFLKHQGDTAFNALFYEFEMSQKIPLTFAMLADKQLETIINTPVASRKLSTRLKGNATKMKKNMNRVLVRGFAKGLSTEKMALQISEVGGASYRRSMNIARTEAGRVTGVTTQKSQQDAINAGARIKKKWVSTLDGSTRHTHQQLDGQVREVDEYFEIAGKKTLQPHMFGRAEEDCNCRCIAISVIKGYEPKLRRDNESEEVIEYKNYEEWRKAKATQQSGAVSGALNDKNDPFQIKRNKFAKDYYDEVRNRDRKNEIAKVANNLGISEDVSEQIFNHVFINKYNLIKGKTRFDPDPDMARSWQRIREGKSIEKHDIIMMEHELYESILMADGFNYDDAHHETEKLYNYVQALKKFEEEGK